MKKLLTLMLAAAVSFCFAADNTKAGNTAPKTVKKQKVRSERPVRHGDYGMAVATTPATRQKWVDSGEKGWWQKRLENKFKQAKKFGKDIDIVLVGDSITHRWEVKDAREAFKDTFGKHRVLNLGCGGDRTNHTLWIIEKSGVFNDISPKLIVLLIGTNNTGGGVSGEIATAAGVKRCVESLRKAAPDSKIVYFAIFPRGNKKGNIRYQKNEFVNESIKTLADNKNVFFVNINQDFLDENGVPSKELLYDYLHPSGAGYKVWGKAIKPYVQRFVDGK